MLDNEDDEPPQKYPQETYLVAKRLLHLQTHGFMSNARRKNTLTPNSVYTFIPSAHQMFNIIAKMDDRYILDSKIEDRDLAWHPFISRIYFGIMFLVRTIQVAIPRTIEDFVRIHGLRTQFEQMSLEDMYVPAPLLECMEELAPIVGSKKPEVWITPTLPEEMGPQQAKDLIDYDEEHCYQLVLPNIPVYLGLLHDFFNEPCPPSDSYHPWMFKKKPRFDDSRDRELNGHAFEKKDWSVLCKTVFLTPGLSECISLIYDGWKSQRQKGRLVALGIPKPQPEDNLRHLLDFMYLTGKDGANWFSLVCDIMQPYLKHFDAQVRLSQIRLGNLEYMPTLTIYVAPSMSGSEYCDSIYKEVTGLGHGKALLTKRILSNEGYFRGLKYTSQPFSRYQLNAKVSFDDYKIWNAVGSLDSTRLVDLSKRKHDMNVMVVHCVPDPTDDLLLRKVEEHSYYSRYCS